LRWVASELAGGALRSAGAWANRPVVARSRRGKSADREDRQLIRGV